MFSDRWRAWKILAALLLLHLGCVYNHAFHAWNDVPLWARPERAQGQAFWLFGDTLGTADPASGILTLAPKGFPLRVRCPPGTWPGGALSGSRLYARIRYDRGDFLLEPGARVTPPTALPARWELWLASVPAAFLVVWLFLRRFRAGLSLEFSQRA